MTALRTWPAVRLVAGREIRQRLRARSFHVSTALLVVVSRIAGDDEPGPLAVAVVGQEAALSEELAAVGNAADREVDVTPYEDVRAARSAVRDGDAEAAVIVDERELVFDRSVDEEVAALVQQAWAASEARTALDDLGLSDQEVGAALAPEPLAEATLDDEDDNDGLAVLVGTAAAILLFLGLQTFGGYVLTGVVEEKSTAVVELLLVRVRSDQLLTGKVLGIGVAALVQMSAAVAAGLVGLAISGSEVPSEIWSSVPMVLVWFLGGYALYSTLFAVAGSLVSRQEDAQAAAAPIMAVLVSAYLLVFFFGYVPDSTASRVLSVLPPMAPFLMPMRMASGAASIVEVVVALVLLVGSVIVAWRLTGKLYEQVLLRRGTRISWASAAALLRNS
jgi:ABC-2 type transport system permease protein